MAREKPRTIVCEECDGSGIHWPANADGYPLPRGWSSVEREVKR